MRNRFIKVINVIILGLLLGIIPNFSPSNFSTNEVMSNLTWPSSAEDFHDLCISLGVSNIAYLNVNSSYNFQIENKGNITDTAEYSIWVNNSKILEGSHSVEIGIPTVTLGYFNFTAPGIYNITAFVSSTSGEDENWEDNTNTEWIEVVSEPVLKYNIGDFMSYHYSELFTEEAPIQLDITYQSEIDDFNVRLEIIENGTASTPILNTYTRKYGSFLSENPITDMFGIFYWQIGLNVSIGSEFPFFLSSLEITNDTKFNYNEMTLNAWVGEWYGICFYYHKETGVLLTMTNSTTNELMVELTDTNMIEISIPHLTSPSDMDMEYGVTPTNIAWWAEDADPTNYILECNGSLIMNSSWINMENITFDMQDYLPGIYVLSLTVYNAMGQFVSESITVTIVDTTAPVISGPNDTIVSEKTVEFELLWNVTDYLPDSYQILKDGIVIFESSWTEGEISFILENLTVGEYIYELRVNDTSGNIATDNVMVTVSNKSVGLPSYLATFLIIAEIIATVGVLIKKNKKI
ncbi:hypothetical protein NEF87_003224 [Candidatus Lokiarchaeum ossiferum]|uniref:CARDB domain-containing protein n=1 Tax=Candidatus Lokiarchaeum ossiferum TaxID=2951803 RepID=A0ABY6HWK8_9ARCH|nr:hypothetical protein NEF87_003224 [Candidatus Lokiarchaeum sp. B-35]